MVKIVPIARSDFTIGLLKGELTGAGPDFFEPMGDEELVLWEGEQEDRG